MQALVKELQTGQLPLVRATGPFGCSLGHKWGGHQVMVIFAGGIGVRAPLSCCSPSTPGCPLAPCFHGGFVGVRLKTEEGQRLRFLQFENHQ